MAASSAEIERNTGAIFLPPTPLFSVRVIIIFRGAAAIQEIEGEFIIFLLFPPFRYTQDKHNPPGRA
jgi:hypothetical protein